MKLKKWFAQLKTIGFFGSGAGIAISAAATKSPTEVVVGASVGSVCGTGINFSFESLEGAADIADRKGVICRIIAALTEFKEDIVDLDLTSGEDSGQLREVNRLIERANILFAQFALHFFCTKEIMHFTQEVENLRKDLTCFCDDVGFLGWEHKILQKKVSMLQSRLDELTTRNRAIGEQLNDCDTDMKKNLTDIEQLLTRRSDLEKRKDEVSRIMTQQQQLVGEGAELEQKQREIAALQDEKKRLDSEIYDVDIRQKPRLEGAAKELEKKEKVLLEEKAENDREIAQKQPCIENIRQKVTRLHSILAQWAEKCGEEQERIRGFLSSTQP